MNASDWLKRALQTLGVAAVGLGSAMGSPAELDRDVEADDAGRTELSRRASTHRQAVAAAGKSLARESLSQLARRAGLAGLTPGATLAAALWNASGIERSLIICDWAVSPVTEQRLAVAQALSYPLEAVGIRTAIEHLRNDANPGVRLAAERAAFVRGVHADASTPV